MVVVRAAGGLSPKPNCPPLAGELELINVVAPSDLISKELDLAISSFIFSPDLLGVEAFVGQVIGSAFDFNWMLLLLKIIGFSAGSTLIGLCLKKVEEEDTTLEEGEVCFESDFERHSCSLLDLLWSVLTKPLEEGTSFGRVVAGDTDKFDCAAWVTNILGGDMSLRNFVKLAPPPTLLPLVMVASTFELSWPFGLLGRKLDIFILFGIPFLSEELVDFAVALLVMHDDDDNNDIGLCERMLLEDETKLVVVGERG